MKIFWSSLYQFFKNCFNLPTNLTNPLSALECVHRHTHTDTCTQTRAHTGTGSHRVSFQPFSQGSLTAKALGHGVLFHTFQATGEKSKSLNPALFFSVPLPPHHSCLLLSQLPSTLLSFYFRRPFVFSVNTLALQCTPNPKCENIKVCLPKGCIAGGTAFQSFQECALTGFHMSLYHQAQTVFNKQNDLVFLAFIYILVCYRLP